MAVSSAVWADWAALDKNVEVDLISNDNAMYEVTITIQNLCQFVPVVANKEFVGNNNLYKTRSKWIESQQLLDVQL